MLENILIEAPKVISYWVITMIAIIRKNTSYESSSPRESSSPCISTYLNWNTMVSTLLYGKDYRDRRFFFPDALYDYHYEFYVAETFSFVQDVKQNCKRCKEGKKRCSYTKNKV